MLDVVPQGYRTPDHVRRDTCNW